MTNKLKLPVSYGNSKLNGRNVMIFNMNAASDCPADTLNMCPLGPRNGDSTCYAFKAERQYPKTCLPYRRRQEEWWNKNKTQTAFLDAVKKGTKYFRFSESGDFRTQMDVSQMTAVCYMLGMHKGITCYGYTRRVDLDLSTLAKVANVIVTGKKVKGCSRSHVLELSLIHI